MTIGSQSAGRGVIRVCDPSRAAQSKYKCQAFSLTLCLLYAFLLFLPRACAPQGETSVLLVIY